MGIVFDTTVWEGQGAVANYKGALYRDYIGNPDAPDFGTWVPYGRRFAENWLGRALPDGEIRKFSRRWTWLTDNFPIQVSDRIIVGGAAFGFLIEAAKNAGYPNIWGIDNSPWIHGKGEWRADVLIINSDFNGGAALIQELRRETGDKVFDWVIDEDMISSASSDAEVADWHFAAETVKDDSVGDDHIIHLTKWDIEPPWLWKTMLDWKATAPTHTWVSLPEYEIF